MSEESGHILQPCPNCAGLLDVTDQEPFAQVHCPMCGTLMRARTQLKNFALTEVLGAGGMGAVYKARDVNLNRMVALKVVRREFSADAEYLAKFEREARITASVNHPHVVKVFSFGSDHGLFYIAMESVDKGSLDDLMSLQGRVAEAQILEVGIQIAQGLQAAHKKGLIHRDVKPGNILFADAHTAKIVDFGLALLAEHEAEERGEVWGTPYYVAPEKLNQEPEDFRSDIYSLGGTLFHALAGRPPFEAESASLVALKHIKSKAVSLQAFAPDVSSATAFVINRMLHKDPSHRYQSYDELLEHLNYARAQLLEAAAKPRKKERVVVESAEQQHFMGMITLAMLAVILGVGVLVFVFRDRLFGSGQTVDVVMSGAPSPAAVRYEAARKQMIDGDFQNAEEAFATLEAQPKIEQPLQSWITVHEGMAALVRGRLEPARGIFKHLTARELPAGNAAEKALAKFFVTVSQIMADPKAASPEVAKEFDKTNFESLALFISALKDWELGKFQDANTLIEAFLASDPQEPFAWISDYKPIAQKYGADFAAYQKASEQAKAAKNTNERAEALSAIAALQKKAHGKMAETLGETERGLQKKFADLDAGDAKQTAEIRDRETKNLAEARKKFHALCAGYQFDAALTAVQNLPASDSTLAIYRDALVKKAEWLVKFKTQLVDDVNRAGYPDPLTKKNGTAVPAGVKKATANELKMQTPYGFIPIPWTDLPPATLLQMSQHLAGKETAPDRIADRKWINGVFAMEFGMTAEGRAMLVDAAQAKEDYRDQLALFIDSSK